MRSTIWMSQRPMLGRLNGLRRRSIRTGSTTPHNRGLHIMAERSEDVKGESAAGRGGVDRLGQRAEPDAAPRSSVTASIRCGSERPSRSSFQTTSTSPSRT